MKNILYEKAPLAGLNILVSKSMKGDLDAFRRIYDFISGKMYSLCLRYAGDREAAKDLFEYGFAKLYLNLHNFNDTELFEYWAREQFVRNAIDFLRKEKMLPAEINKQILTGSANVVCLESIRPEALIMLISRLPAKQRTVFNLYRVEGYGHKAIAAMLDITEQKSRDILKQADMLLMNLCPEAGKQH